MSNPTRIPIIVGGVIGVVALALCLFLPKDEQQDPSLQDTKPTTGIQIQVPTGPTDPTDDPPVIIIPGDDDPLDPTNPTDPTNPQPGDAFVEGGGEEEEIKDIPKEDPTDPPADNVIDTGKKEDEEQDVSQGEIRNDVVLEEKEESAEEQLPPEEEHEVIVEDEQTTVGGEKGEVHEEEDEPNPDGDESNKNAPEYQPPAGGDNPFDDDTETEIEDVPVEDLIGDGEDAPAEGTHF